MEFSREEAQVLVILLCIIVLLASLPKVFSAFYKDKDFDWDEYDPPKEEDEKN